MLRRDVADCFEGLLIVTSGSKGHKVVWRYVSQRESVEEPRMVLSTFHETLDKEYVNRRTRLTTDPSKLFDDLDITLVADILSPKIGLCDKRFQLSLNQYTYLGHPLTLSQPQNVSESGDVRMLHSMSLFHLVFLMRSTRQTLLDEMYRHIVRPLSMALKYEQSLCGYLTNEIELIHSMYDSGVSGKDLQHRLYRSSQFIRELTDIANALKKGQSIGLRIHDWIRLDASLDDLEELGPHSIHPYQTLLLVDNASKLIQSLPGETSSVLIRFLQHVHPQKR
jgi:nitrogen permease regulator 3-like protein